MPELRPDISGLQEFARGKEKIAYNIPNKSERVWIGWRDEKLKQPEIGKAVFWMQRILHLLAPENFLSVSYGDREGINVLRSPSSPDFVKAQEIIKKQQETGIWEKDEWFEDKRKEIRSMPKYQELAELLKTLCGSYYDFDELPSPVNMVVSGDEPVIIELFNPIVYRENRYWQSVMAPFITKGGLETALASEWGANIDEEERERIRRYFVQYEQNVLQYVAKNSPDEQITNTATPPEDKYETLEEIPEELASISAPW